MMLAIEIMVSNAIANRIEDSNSTLARLNFFKLLFVSNVALFAMTF
jgi:hypothetical protein